MDTVSQISDYEIPIDAFSANIDTWKDTNDTAPANYSKSYDSMSALLASNANHILVNSNEKKSASQDMKDTRWAFGNPVLLCFYFFFD